jgi:hypothetical protein
MGEDKSGPFQLSFNRLKSQQGSVRRRAAELGYAYCDAMCQTGNSMLGLRNMAKSAEPAGFGIAIMLTLLLALPTRVQAGWALYLA